MGTHRQRDWECRFREQSSAIIEKTRDSESFFRKVGKEKDLASVTISRVQKIYENGFHAVHDLNLAIKDGEFLVLVGPSGCGKSTSMRMVAGLEDITEGEIKIGQRVVNNIPPKDRNVAMVFQDYALYPHMTVRQNMSLSLKLRKVPKDEINKRVENAARVLDIAHVLDNRPKELSGGQRQRVAVGRAIVRTPDVFMFDEPLSNLDPKLRTTMRVELKKLHLQLQTTMIYVTHDQLEAMTLADRIVVMNQGRVQQVGTPLEVYSRPTNQFVAGFIGTPPMNFFPCSVEEREGILYLHSEAFDFALPENHPLRNKLKEKTPSQQFTLGVRPEHIQLARGQAGPNQIQATVEVMEPMAPEVFVHLASESGQFVLRDDSLLAPVVRPGEKVRVNVDLENIHLFDREGTAL